MTETADAIRRAAFWFEPDVDGFGALFDFGEDADVVLIGEATHGTEQFYRIRSGRGSTSLRLRPTGPTPIG
jgi:erythromycin esterase-like protein